MRTSTLGAAQEATSAVHKPVTVQCASRGPFNEALQTEANEYLLHERVAEAAAGLAKGESLPLDLFQGRHPLPRELLIELDDGERVGYPPSMSPPHTGGGTVAVNASRPATLEKINPCTCTSTAFDAWLRTVVQSIPPPTEAGNSGRMDGYFAASSRGRARPGSAQRVTREQTICTALELLETAARLLQRRIVLCRDQDRLLHAYYDALEEDIYQQAKAGLRLAAEGERAHFTSNEEPQMLLPPEQHKYSPYHHHLRMYKRGAPLKQYSEEQAKLHHRLEMVYYVLTKLEELEGVNSAILLESQSSSQMNQATHEAGEGNSTNIRNEGSSQGGLTVIRRGGGVSAEQDGDKMVKPLSLSSRRFAAWDQRVCHLRRQLQLPIPAWDVMSRLRNELILSFSARVLALRELGPPPFRGPDTTATSSPAAHDPDVASQSVSNVSSQQDSSNSISAFVEWYVKHIMDPLAISQLLSIVPREYLVTTTCRLIYACEAHASLRSSRALPDLGTVLMCAVAEGRAEAVSQVLLSSSVSYGSALSGATESHTCFFAGLFIGQLDVLKQLVEHQCWNADALHVLLFVNTPWNAAAVASTPRGCHVYQQALIGRVQAFLAMAKRALDARSDALTYDPSLQLNDSSNASASVSTSGDYLTDEMALKVLRAAHLLDMNAQGEKALLTLTRLLATASSNSISDVDDDGGGAAAVENARSPDGAASGVQTMLYAPQPVVAPPPVFLSGALRRLRLFLAARTAMLEYEQQQQNVQWSSLLGHIKSSVATTSGVVTSPTLSSTYESQGNLLSANRMHGDLPKSALSPSTSNLRSGNSKVPASSFGSVLHRQQQQLDACTAAAVCPLRCRMCPAFTTPHLQRVDAWSYTPLHSTTLRTALDNALDIDDEDKERQSSERRAYRVLQATNLKATTNCDACHAKDPHNEPSGYQSEWASHQPPILALLMRSDTAIDMTARSWFMYPSVGRATLQKEGDGDRYSSRRGAPSTSPRSVIKCDSGSKNTFRGYTRRHVSPWQSCYAPTSLITNLPFRYSLSVPLENARRAALDAKQRRAVQILYGGPAPGGIEDNAMHSNDGDEVDNYSSISGDGTADESLAGASSRLAAQLPGLTKPSLYYEAQISLDYLIAMYVADTLGAASPTIGEEALEHDTRDPLPREAAHRLCENCVVVGLCDCVTAAQANGSTRGPHKPYLVTHLGHQHHARDIAGITESDNINGLEGLEATRGHVQGESTFWSAGVSVSVIAHEEMSQRSLSSGTDAGARSTNQNQATPRGSEVDTDVFYLGLWKHQQNIVRALSATQTHSHHATQDASQTSLKTAPVFLRLELRRRCAAAPVKASTPKGESNTCAEAGDKSTIDTHDMDSAETGPGKRGLWLPTITRASQDDVAKALRRMRLERHHSATSATRAARMQATRGHARRTPSPPSRATDTSPSLTRFSHAPYQVPATLVLGIFFISSTGTLRLRINNFTDIEEIVLGLPLGSDAYITEFTESAMPLPPLLYPAATLSLNDSGWRSWHAHRTRQLAVPRQPSTQQKELGREEGKSEHVQVRGGVPLSSASCLSQPVSNAVLHFSFDATELLFEPPPPHHALTGTSTSTIRPVTEVMTVSEGQQLGQGNIETDVESKISNVMQPQLSEPVVLLDNTVKFTQMLSVLTDLVLRTAVGQGREETPEEPQSSRPDFGDEYENDKSDDDNADAATPGDTAPKAHSSVSFVGSRERRLRSAVRRVQSLLNTPGGGALNTTVGHCSPFGHTDLPNLFYPPVRIYRHSCHLPPQELYPPPPSCDAGSADEGKGSGQRMPKQRERRRWRRGNRRIGLQGAVQMPSLASTNMFWHDLIPENVPLTPLCAALASRQPTMAYVIATHPLTKFCDPIIGEERASSVHVWQQQSYQRRTALYAACALGYAEVVRVLLERIPVEEILSYFGLIVESETRSELRRTYAKASVAFLRNYQRNWLKTQASSPPGNAAKMDTKTSEHSPNTTTTQTLSTGRHAGISVRPLTPAVPYLTNDKQRPLLNASTIYISSRSMYTPLHVTLLGVVLDNGDQDTDGVEENTSTDTDDEKASLLLLKARLSKQTKCVTVLLNCLYDLLCVAPTSNGTTQKPKQRKKDDAKGKTQSTESPLAGKELLASALNLYTTAGETALLLAVRHNNVAVALRLLELGVEVTCMDRVTRLLSLELACANRCTPIAEALLQPRSGSGGTEAAMSTSAYVTSPVLLNHAGIATALCWCAINNMPAVMQRLLECDGIDAESGFEGSSPLHLAIAFDSEEAALTLLRGTQPRKGTAAKALLRQSADSEKRQASQPVTATAALKAAATRLCASVLSPNARPKPFMNANILHGRTHSTPLHLACERGQLNIIRVLLHSWNAQLNLTAAYTSYTPLLSAIAHGKEEAALRVLEYSKDQLRRGRAVLDLCAFDQQGNTALHLAARQGLTLALEYMLVQFSEDEITRLVGLHPALAESQAYKSGTCVVPIYATNNHGKTALLVAVQYDQAETAELLVSMLIDSVEASEVKLTELVPEEKNSPRLPNTATNNEEAYANATADDQAAPSSTMSETANVGGTLIDGTCLALHQAQKKRLDAVVQLMLSASPSLFPRTAEFCASVELLKQQQADRRRPTALMTITPSSAKDPSAVENRKKIGQVVVKAAEAGSPLQDNSMVQDRTSFVRLLLTGANGPSSPDDALRVLLRGFALPELYVYLSKVASESAALGVQGGAAMAHSELLVGYLQEHASTVVAPTRVVVFCRAVLECMRQWMSDEASAARERIAASKRRRSLRRVKSGIARPYPPQGSLQNEEPGQRTQREVKEAPIDWLYRILFSAYAPAARGTRSKSTLQNLISPLTTSTTSSVLADITSPQEEAACHRDALDATMKRKTLSLDVARMIRLHGRSQGGARAIEEIKSVVQAYVKSKISEHERLKKQTMSAATGESSEALTMSDSGGGGGGGSDSKSNSLHPQASHDSDAQSIMYLGEPHHNYINIVGNEELFTTPMGFTVLQLAAGLCLPEVVDFLVKTYKLNPLYTPTQDLYARAGLSTTLETADTHPREPREEEELRVRSVLSHTVSALARVGVRSTRRGDYGEWFCWTPYWLAVHTGNTQCVKTLLLAGSMVSAPAVAVDGIAHKDACPPCTDARPSSADKDWKESGAVVGKRTTASSEERRTSAIVDYKEPAWLSPYQRTALQECIVMATKSGMDTSLSNTSADSLAPLTPSSSGAPTPSASLLPAPLAMVALLLQFGAQSTGLFDDTGSDAWLLALAGSGAAELPMTSRSYTTKPMDIGSTKSRPGEPILPSSHPQLSPSRVPASGTTPLTSIGTSVSEAAGQRCIELLLRFRVPLLGCVPESPQRVKPHVDDSGPSGVQESAERRIIDRQILNNAPRLLHQWRRLPCMRLAPAGTAVARLALKTLQASEVPEEMPNDSGSEGDDDVGDKDDTVMGQMNTVFEKAHALWLMYAEEKERLESAGATADTACDATKLPSHSAVPETPVGPVTAPLTSMSIFRFPGSTPQGKNAVNNGKGVASEPTWQTDGSAKGCHDTFHSAVLSSLDLLKVRVITALRLCYRVVLLYTCVEYTPMQLLRLVHAFGTTMIPVSMHHPLSGDSVATRLLRKTHTRLLTGTSERSDSASNSNFLPGAHESSRASLVIHDTSEAPRLSLKVLDEPPCIGNPYAEPETRLLIDTCVTLVHLFGDGLEAQLRPSSASRSKSISVESTEAENAICSLLFQPSCDGETALSLAARIADAPLISVLVKNGAAASQDSDSHSRSRSTLWHSAPRQDDGSDIEEAADMLNVTNQPGSTVYSLRTNMEDIVLRRLLATRVYYPAHEIDTLRILLAHMPDEAARRCFLRWVYPNVHPIPALQLTMDNVDVAGHFLTSSHCMNALWANLLYARFNGWLDTMISAKARAWNSLLRIVLPGAPAVPIYLIMRAAVQEDGSTRDSQVGQPKQQLHSSADAPKPLTPSKKRPKTPPDQSKISNWSHIVRCTSVFLQLMTMSVAETLMSNLMQPSPSQLTDAPTLSPTPTLGAKNVQHAKSLSTTPSLELKKKTPAPVESVPQLSEGLAGTLLWDIIELAVRYDDKDVLQYLLQLRLPDLVLRYISSIRQQTPSSSVASGGAPTPPSAATRSMEAASAAILESYPSFVGVSTTSQANGVLERLQRLLWKDAVQKHHIDLLAVAAGSVSTLQFLYKFSPPEVRALMTPMRYDRIDLNSGMPEGMTHLSDLRGPAGAMTKTEQSSDNQHMQKSLLLGDRGGGGGDTLSRLPLIASRGKGEADATAMLQIRKSSFSEGTASVTLHEDGGSWSTELTPETLASLMLPVKGEKTSNASGGRGGDVLITDTPPLLLRMDTKDGEERGNVDVGEQAELHFMESCVRNGRRPLAPREERRRRVTAVTWGLGAAACPVSLPMPRVSLTNSLEGNADTQEFITAPGEPAEVQPCGAPTLPQVVRTSVQGSATTPSSNKTGDAHSRKNTSKETSGKGKKTSPSRTAQSRAQKSLQAGKMVVVPQEAEVHSLATAPSTPTVALEPIYFMYLQLDWALHSTLLFRSPRPSGATLDTIFFLLDQRAPLSVPVLDLFLAGSVAPSGTTLQELAISLFYQTREHQDTLLHLLVLHDQCQLTEYYLEYCYLWFVSNGFDPSPVSCQPGRFPLDDFAASTTCDSSDDGHDENGDARFGNGCTDAQDMGSGQPLQSLSHGTPSSRMAGKVPCEFLRCMLRVNAHGLTAFDYAHSPAMLQLLMWYGCVPPTYRPNPRAFRKAVFFNKGRRTERSDVREAFILVGNRDHHDGADATARMGSLGRGSAALATMHRRREVLRFFPVPRLVLATDNFTSLMDPTGKELASMVGVEATGSAHKSPAETSKQQNDSNKSDPDIKSIKKGLLESNLAQQEQLNSRRLSLMVTAEQRQLQVFQRRRQQQERAKAILFDQVAAQSKVMVARRGGADGKAATRTNTAAMPFLTRTVTSQIRKQWEEQRHPLYNVTILLRNALEAQRMSASALGSKASRGKPKRPGESSVLGSSAGLLPILLTEEVSLLHLGLCSFEDELVRLYGTLQTTSASATASTGSSTAQHRSNEEGDNDSDGSDSGPKISTYTRLLLPPSLTGRSSTQQPQQQGDRAERRGAPGALEGVFPAIGKRESISDANAGRIGNTARPRTSIVDVSVGKASPSPQHGRQSIHGPETADGGTSMPPRLTQMDVIFLLESQQFVVFPLSMPNLDYAGEASSDGGDDPNAGYGDGHEVGMRNNNNNNNRLSSAKKGNIVPSSLPIGEGKAALGELPELIERCTGGDTGATNRRSKPLKSDTKMTLLSSSALVAQNVSGGPLAPPQGSSSGSRRGLRHPPAASDLPLLRSLMARKTTEDFSSELIDVAARRYNAALMVSLTPMALAGISGRTTGTARMSAVSRMKKMALRLRDTKWKQFGTRPVLASNYATTASTEVIALLNVPPFTSADASLQQSQGATSSTGAAADERGAGTVAAAPSPSAATIPTVMAARLEEWVARRWPMEKRVGCKSSGKPRIGSTPAQRPGHIPKAARGSKGSDEMDEEDDDNEEETEAEAPPSVLDQIIPVGGVATAAQQALMRALLKSFTAATGAQLSEQMGLIITPNYDVVESGDTAAALRGHEGMTPKPLKAQAKR